MEMAMLTVLNVVIVTLMRQKILKITSVEGNIFRVGQSKI